MAAATEMELVKKCKRIGENNVKYLNVIPNFIVKARADRFISTWKTLGKKLTPLVKEVEASSVTEV